MDIIRSLKLISVFLAIFLFLNLKVDAQPEISKKLAGLDDYFGKALTDWEVPGMAIGIVKDDSLLFAKGYGVRHIGEKVSVDINTIFPIASNTKAFTSAAMAILVEEGKLSWDDKAIRYLPYFELYDPWVTANMTIRDLLCHRSGLETFSGDLVWYGSSYTREEVIKRAKYLEPTYEFRTHFGYQNIMFIAAGEIISKVSGKSWDDFIADRFFKPLQMNRSTTTISDFDELGNIAMPHTTNNDQVVSIPFMNWDNIGGAGAINCCVADMGEWLKLQLNQGKYNDKVIFSDESSQAMWSAHTVQNVSEGAKRLWPSLHFKAYGLGWSLFDYHGRKIVGHSGGYDGILSYTCLVPEENLGFVILTNRNSSLYYSLIYKILDTFLSDNTTDWSTKFLERTKSFEERKKQEKKEKEEARVRNTNSSLKLSEYTGTYHCSLYGDVEVKLENRKLVLYFIPTPGFIGILDHWHFDTFSIKLKNTPSLPEGSVQFILDTDGHANELRIDIPNPDFDFTELKLFRK